MRTRARAWALLGALALLAPAAASAQDDATAASLPAALRDVGIDQRVGAQLPLDLRFRDDHGRSVRLGDYFGKRPVILVPVYYRCPMLCPMVLDGMARSLKVLTFTAARDYELVVFSFDSRETPEDAAKAKRTALETFETGRKGDGNGDSWHFLVGDKAEVEALSKAVGFRYTYDQGRAEYVHASSLILATPAGQIARYMFTTDPAPKDLRFSLIEASAGKLGTVADQVLLFCYRYDPHTGKYTLLTMRLVRTAAALTVLGLGLFIVWMVRQEKRGARAAAIATAAGTR